MNDPCAAEIVNPEARSQHRARLGFDRLPGWAEDDHAAALACFLNMPLRWWSTEFADAARDPGRAGMVASLEAAMLRARTVAPGDAEAARAFFERSFTVHPVGLPAGERGFVTGYFEPVLDASRERTPSHCWPLYAPPPNLVEATDDPPSSDMQRGWRFRLRTAHGDAQPPDRRAIRTGALDGLGLEIAWLDDPVDQFLVHVQGSARLRFADTGEMRLCYAAKNGFPYVSIGRHLVETGMIAQQDMTMAVLCDWLRADLERGLAVMDLNPSYIFFHASERAPNDGGPVGDAGIALTAGRSLAVDPRHHAYGTPIFVATAEPVGGDRSVRGRLMVAQDTGSAITGEARGDLFIGSGRAAGEIAGAIRQDADFYVLQPRDMAEAAA